MSKFQNISSRYVLFLFLFVIPGTGIAQSQFIFDVLRHVSVEDLDNQYRTLFLPESWKFNSVDNSSFAKPDYDDWDWISLSTALESSVLEAVNWDGMGWFRLALDVDSSLIGHPLAVDITSISGQATLFLNGEKLFRTNANSTLLIHAAENVFTFAFPKPGRNVLAIRYQNTNSQWFSARDLPSGLRFSFVDATFYTENIVKNVRRISQTQFFFSGTLLVFSMLHLLLFFYYRKQPENLFFALFTLSFALFIVAYQQNQLIIDIATKVQVFHILEVLRSLAIVFFMRFVYELLTTKVSEFRFAWIWLAVGVYLILALRGYSYHLLYLDIVYLLLAADSLALLGMALYKKRKGAAIFGIGLGVFVFANLFMVITSFELATISREWLGVIGTGTLLITMSVSLSRNFALTNARLEANLIEVQRLSDEALVKERKLKKEELEKKLLAADNARKTAELEEARKLQLSLLPKVLPDMPGFEVVAEMIPASEVGGDYYDYTKTEDATILTIGDATGHGVKAGIIVATTKSFFHTHAAQCDNITLLHKMSAAVKNMDVHMMYMGITLMRFQKNNVEITAAGMPPLIYFNAVQKKTTLLTLKGMPLGSVKNYPYQSINLEMHTGDILIAVSDGLPELFSPDKNMYDYHRAQALITQYAHDSCSSIKEKLLADAKKWAQGKGNQDDITVMIIKKES